MGPEAEALKGFRFVCGFLPTRAAASSTDKSFDFHVKYVGMDGGETNRQFMNLNFPGGAAISEIYCD